MIADLALVTSSIPTDMPDPSTTLGFKRPEPGRLTFEIMLGIYHRIPGLALDKLKAVLEYAWACIHKHTRAKGLIFAYDEAQNMSDKGEKNEYPLSLMLDLFQSLQKKDIPCMLVLSGLPTLHPKLVEARTFAERMFRVLFLDSLKPAASREAILKPIQQAKCPIKLSESWIKVIIQESAGYPYFIQFICREVYDAALQHHNAGKTLKVSIEDVTRKLDTDFFAGRWARATDRQRELLEVVARLSNSDREFSAQQVFAKTKKSLKKPFAAAHVSQMFANLADAGLIYKNRHGKYSFAIPLFGKFILRQAR